MKKLLSLILLSTLLLATSCNKDEPEDEPTVAEIQADINNTFDGFVSCMQGFENGKFSSTLQSFFVINNGDVDEDFAELLTDELGEFEFDLENFNMANHSGVYNWSTATEMWNYVPNTSNTLVFNFPLTNTSATNNLKVTINYYELQSFVISGKTEYFPKRFLGSVEKNGEEFFNIDLDDVTYRHEGDQVVTSNFNLEIRTDPMTHVFELHDTDAQQAAFSYSSHNNNSCSTTISLNASTVVPDFVQVDDLNDFDVVSGTIGHDNLDVRFAIQTDNLANIDDPTANQINALVEAKVYLNDSEVGELEVADENDQTNIYIVYNDGTKENIDNYINQDLADELEAVFSNFIE